MENFETLLISLPVLIFSVVCHEVAHAWVARQEGDNTAYMLGRITLNPIPHLDPVGSILVPGLLALTGSGLLFGWARPVPVNPRNYHNYRRGDIRVSLAGITVNFILAVVFALLLVPVVILHQQAPALGPSLELLYAMFRFGVLINIVLAFFNLIPIPPLDGSHVLYHFLPPGLGLRYRELQRFGMLPVIAFIFLGGSAILRYPVFFLYGLLMALVRAATGA
jgi:Zn-dependent protease